MKTVLFVTLYTEIGGGEVSLLNLMANLDRTRYSPVLLAPNEGPLTAAASAANVPILVEQFPVVSLKSLAHPGTFLSLMRAGGRVRRRIETLHPDLIQCSDVLALMLLAPALIRTNIPLVFSKIFFYEPVRIFALWLLDRLFVDRIVVCSEGLRDHLINHIPSLAADASVIYMSVDSARFVPMDSAERKEARESFGLPADAAIALLVARFDTWKGHMTFLRALESIRDSNAGNSSGREKIVGVMAGGAFTASVVPQVRRYHESVLSAAADLIKSGSLIVKDHVDEIERLTGCADVLVCPSDREPYGLVVLEAFSAGIPVVATTTVHALEVMPESRHLYSCPPHDAMQFADGIRAAVANPPTDLDRTGMHQSMLGLNWKHYADEFQTLYDSLS